MKPTGTRIDPRVNDRPGVARTIPPGVGLIGPAYRMDTMSNTQDVISLINAELRKARPAGFATKIAGKMSRDDVAWTLRQLGALLETFAEPDFAPPDAGEYATVMLKRIEALRGIARRITHEDAVVRALAVVEVELKAVCNRPDVMAALYEKSSADLSSSLNQWMSVSDARRCADMLDAAAIEVETCSWTPAPNSRHAIFLQALIEAGAVDETRLATSDMVAKRATNQTGNDVKKVVAKLAEHGYIKTRGNRGGGVWLTAKGKAYVAAIKHAGE
jgi:hypothetical protein